MCRAYCRAASGRGQIAKAGRPERKRGSEVEAGNKPQKERIVYELWSDADLKWIEIDVGSQIELAQFLESWCEKNSTIFRRRPFGEARAYSGYALVHPIHGRIEVSIQLPLDLEADGSDPPF